MTEQTKVFISYDRAEAERAKALSMRLAQRGLLLWRDELILAGQDWANVIHDAISESRVFLVLISEHFLESKIIRLELGAILSARRSRRDVLIIPILLSPATMEDMPESLRAFQFLELKADNENEVADAIVDATKTNAVNTEATSAEGTQLGWRRSASERTEIMQRKVRKRRLTLIGFLVVLVVVLTSLVILLLGSGPARPKPVDLSGVDLSQKILDGVRMSGARLVRVNLNNASLRRVDLRGADLTSANLHSTDLTGADLRGANLERADLSGAKLRGTDLSRVVGLTMKQLDSACGDKETKIPFDLKPPPLCDNQKKPSLQ
jgi:uncharacterized protein YjbI with pentapeptide repeats